MTHLVGQRGDALEVVGVVEQHVGVHVVGPAGGVGARPLAGRRVPVDPARVERPRQHLDVALAQRLQRVGDEPARLARCEAPLGLAAQRAVLVEVLLPPQPQRATAQLQIAVQQRKLLAHLPDQVAVDRGRHVVAVERRRHARLVAPHARAEQVRLDRGVQVLAQRVVEIAVGPEVGREELHPVVAVGGGAVLLEGDRGELDDLPVGERHLGPRHVDVVQHVVQGRRHAGDQARLGQQPLLGGREHVGPLAHQVAQEEGVHGQTLVLPDERLDRRRLHLQDLRPQPGDPPRDRRGQKLGALAHRLAGRVTRVGVGLQRRVGAQLGEPPVGLGDLVQRLGEHGSRRGQPPLPALQIGSEPLERGPLGLERLVVGEQLGEIPRFLDRNGGDFQA